MRKEEGRKSESQALLLEPLLGSLTLTQADAVSTGLHKCDIRRLFLSGGLPEAILWLNGSADVDTYIAKDNNDLITTENCEPDNEYMTSP